ncbi:hypothetical protein EK904_001911, partial [Melospiza melodia maxima]
MREAEVRRLLAANLLCALAIVLATLGPAFVLDGFSVLGTHLTWLCVCSVCVATLNIILHLVLKPNQSPKRRSFGHKVSDGDIFVCSSSVYIYYFTMLVFAGTKHTGMDTELCPYGKAVYRLLLCAVYLELGLEHFLFLLTGIGLG